MKELVPPLSRRIAGTAPLIDVRSPEDYLKYVIRRALVDAANEGRLSIGPDVIARHVRLDRRSKITPGASDLVSGEKGSMNRVIARIGSGSTSARPGTTTSYEACGPTFTPTTRTSNSRRQSSHPTS